MINLKYDTWQKDLQARFGSILVEEVRSIHAQLLQQKCALENVYLDGPTKDIVSGVETILKVKNGFEAMERTVFELESSEKLLQKQRFQFPPDWLPVSNLLGVLADLAQLLDRRNTAMASQLSSLQQKVREEDAIAAERGNETIAQWERDKPVSGSLTPSEALFVISQFQQKVEVLNDNIKRSQAAKTALGMEFIPDDRMLQVVEELADLTEAWQAILPTCDKLNVLRSVPMKDLTPTKIRKQVEDFSTELKALPAKVRTYHSYEHLQDRLAKYIAMQPMLRDLFSEALKERHWRVLLKAFGSIGVQASNAQALSLGALWDANLPVHKKLIFDTLSTAQGESALEQFLKDLREYWHGAELSLVLRDGFRLIVGWDILFSMLEDHLNSLASLKQSPYFRNVQEFQEETHSWENRLTSLRAIFDIWVEVQRKWVYLRGIFRSADIKSQLPSQYGKFKSVDLEFSNVLKRVAGKPGVMDLLQVENLLRQLERQDTTMGIIQKALGEYLEKQRQLFPRFYFVNNDDLVEIIGNSNEPTKVIPHLSKMFAAINSLLTESKASDSDLTATALCSKEGEQV